MRKIFILLSATLFFFNCSPNKNITNNDSINISFGNGGGFTGIETKYTLKKNGSIIKFVNRDSTLVKQLDTKELNTIYAEAKSLKDYKYFKPDNIYQFIEINNNRIVWGFTIENVNPTAVALYKTLTELINTK